MRALRSKIEDHSMPVTECGCWIWMRALGTQGYGQMVYRKMQGAHRLSYLAFKGEIPFGKQVLHTCDIRACVNPDHLYTGTPKQNIADMYKRGRANDVCGSRIGTSKLTEDKIPIIRQLLKAGVSQYEIGRRFGVSQQPIAKINLGKTWRHVP